MPTTKKHNDIEVAEDLEFQRKEWTAERWGWVFMLVVTIAALLGLFGQGPLSSASAENGALGVHYNRFERLLAPGQINIQIGQANIQNGEIRLTIDEEVLQAYTVQTIIPEPESVEVTPGEYIYVFKAAQVGQSLDIIFDLQPNRIGQVSGEVGLENGPAVRLNQFIYP